MRLATLRTTPGDNSLTFAARITADNRAEKIEGFDDVGQLLQQENWREIAEAATGNELDFTPGHLAPVILSPRKIICVGLNYTHHIKEMGRELPDYPTLFIKFPEAITGPYDDIHVPEYASHALDWEGELAVIIGKRTRRVAEEDAEDYIAGYAIGNDYTMRDFQNRTLQWHQGKSLEGSAGFGPWLTTSDEFSFGGHLRTFLDGEQVQDGRTDDLLFTPQRLVEYISHIYPLNPGDVIFTGTPDGVGHARNPQRYIAHGQTVRIEIDGIGHIENTTYVQ